MVGIHTAKQGVVDMVLQRSQVEFRQTGLGHILIFGRPGVGKTTLARVLAKVLAVMGCSKSSKVVHANSANMIAGFLGQTAGKMESLVHEALGGVLLVDEASSLADGRSATSGDSFSKSAIDTLNRLLTEKGDEFTCILAGSEHEIHRDFMSINPGLQRRFNRVFRLDDYSPSELSRITTNKLISLGFDTDLPTVPDKWFKGTQMRYFKAMAGDVDILVNHIVQAHAYVSFGKKDKYNLLPATMEQGFSNYVETRKLTSGKDLNEPPYGMYI
jgi:SpoVK/Ycf46/Vps4 family AAA+-type ATPase